MMGCEFPLELKSPTLVLELVVDELKLAPNSPPLMPLPEFGFEGVELLPNSSPLGCGGNVALFLPNRPTETVYWFEGGPNRPVDLCGLLEFDELLSMPNNPAVFEPENRLD